MYSKLGSSASVGSTNRTKDDINPISGLCGTCWESCIGLCEVGRSAIRGPEIIYPQPFGDVTAAAVKSYPLDWDSFNIMGTAAGAQGMESDSDKAIFTHVKVEIVLAAKNGKEGIRLRIPTTIPGLGSTDVAKKNWEALAAGSAISGVLLTVGENVVGMDEQAKIANGRVKDSPALKSRIQAYKKWQQKGYGAIIVQENVEDNRLGVLEYALEQGADGVEIKWGQGAKDIGGEVKMIEHLIGGVIEGDFKKDKQKLHNIINALPLLYAFNSSERIPFYIDNANETIRKLHRKNVDVTEYIRILTEYSIKINIPYEIPI